jgi:hypothetical protein
MSAVRIPSVPLRPLTVGELLDAAAEVTRAAGPALLPIAALLAAAEQVLMVGLRTEFFGGSVFPSVGKLVGPAWFGVAVGAGTEVLIISLLGIVAGRAAAAGAVGASLRAGQLLGGRRLPSAVVLALFEGSLVFAVSLLPLGWLVAYPLLGMATVAVIIDGSAPARAWWRGIALNLRGGGRGGAIRLLGYLAWLMARLAFGLGSVAGLHSLGIVPGAAAAPWVSAAFLFVINTVAYASLAGLNAVLLIETRIRTEGLDIALTRMPGQLAPEDLAVRR